MTENVQGPFFIDEWKTDKNWYVKAKERSADNKVPDGDHYYIVIFGVSKKCAQEHADRLNACVKLWLEGQQNV